MLPTKGSILEVMIACMSFFKSACRHGSCEVVRTYLQLLSSSLNTTLLSRAPLLVITRFDVLCLLWCLACRLHSTPLLNFIFRWLYCSNDLAPPCPPALPCHCPCPCPYLYLIVLACCQAVCCLVQLLSMMAQSSEFGQMAIREEELPELDALARDACHFDIKGGPENKHGKVNILLQVSTNLSPHLLPLDVACSHVVVKTTRLGWQNG